MVKKKKKEFERINLYLDVSLYNTLKQNADKAFLPIATWTRQLIQKSLHMENNLKIIQKTDGRESD
jgi:hypothetical protein